MDYCSAKTKEGNPCQLPAIEGTDKCRIHTRVTVAAGGQVKRDEITYSKPSETALNIAKAEGADTKDLAGDLKVKRKEHAETDEVVQIKVSRTLTPSIGDKNYSFERDKWSKPISGDVLRVMRDSGYIIAEKEAK